MQIHTKDIQQNKDTLIEQIFCKAEYLFINVGIRNTTMDDLASELGISKKTLYKTIDNKADLIHKCLLFDINRKEEELFKLQKDSKDALDEMLKIGTQIFVSIGRYKISVVHDLMKFYPESWQLITKHKENFTKKIIEDNLKKGIAQGIYRKDINTDMYAKFFIYGTDNCLDMQIFPEEAYTYSNVFKEFFIYHLHGIIANTSDKKIINQINKFLELK